MTSLRMLAASYVLGGLTFVPVLVAITLIYAFITLPRISENTTSHGDAEKEEDTYSKQSTITSAATGFVADELKPRVSVPDVAAGYFAVCREYVPGGINGKPPERTSPSGAVIALESPSVYQSMYRSIFDRNKNMSPSVDIGAGKSKKGRNVFYVVLRHAHLMLYDDSEQLEVRHVISLANYWVDIYAGGEAIPEGDLWIKRNCIRLTQRTQDEPALPSKPFFLFSDNSSEKEDFYHAILQNQGSYLDHEKVSPTPLRFDTADLVKLVQQLHASEDNLHTRWMNALIGRLFLSTYKTAKLEEFVWTKITKKIARVPKPSLISGVKVQKVDMGNLPPFITNPKLKSLTVDGDLVVEADVNYKGNFRLEISAIARIELGSRFKAREVTLVLATILKRLEGHILIRIKPPPSNRLWLSFESAPQMEFAIEPIVSTRQITYGVILRTIESRIREVISETLVFPNWDDIPFSDTVSQHIRGGIWDMGSERAKGHKDIHAREISLKNTEVQTASLDDAIKESSKSRATTSNDNRKATSSSAMSDHTKDTGYSSSTDLQSIKPKAMRAGSFARAASPIVNMDPVNATAPDEWEYQTDATTAMKSTMSRSQPSSPIETSIGSSAHAGEPNDISLSSANSSLDSQHPIHGQFAHRSLNSSKASFLQQDDAPTSEELSPKASFNLTGNSSQAIDRRAPLNLNSATTVAKKWLGSRQNVGPPNSKKRDSAEDHVDFASQNASQNFSGTLSKPSNTSQSNPGPKNSLTQPMGRGQPLPPPGTPLPPPPKRNTWSVTASSFANLTRRRPPLTNQPVQQDWNSGGVAHTMSMASHDSMPVAVGLESTQYERASIQSNASRGSTKSSPDSVMPKLPTLPKRRERPPLMSNNSDDTKTETLLVVEAPQDGSAPASPLFSKNTNNDLEIYEDGTKSPIDAGNVVEARNTSETQKADEGEE